MPRPSAADLAKAPKYATVMLDPEDLAPMVGNRFRALRDGEVVWTDQGERMDLASFVEGSVRCTESGVPVVSLSIPLHAQYHGLSSMPAEMNEDVQAHLEDIRAMREALPANPLEIADINERASVHMLDALMAGLTDRPVAPAQERGPDPLIRLMARETRIEEDNWSKLADMPEFQAAPLRRLARDMLAPVLGNAASLEDLRLIMIPKDEIERGGALRRWIAGCKDSREIEPFRHPAMPGYVTGVPILAERDDVTMVTFQDMMATYAYVWKTTPDVVLDVGPEDDEDDAPRPAW